ncbi:hypothetical protein [Lactobacillus sp. ESL0677]|uniref:hypothetical protein n=1 Tax=Lactobacillus sp. ESL0677 TaxID=2983208 RepID=UPI0023F72947|nr:hypothetical protein [Lactobacillus sp. ESL0677]WEV36251.1 hypothetical protein OZX76_05755 [Lactobacillus sp. ESL0677]
MIKPEYLNQKDAAKLMGISTTTFVRWVKDEIPVCDFHGVRRYSIRVLHKYMKEHEVIERC